MNINPEFGSAAEIALEWLKGDPDGTMFDVCIEKPELAWAVILDLAHRQLTEDQRAFLAGGPIESLLAWHGPEFIDRFEEKATCDPRFNHLLGGVWRHDMPEEIWDRIVKVRKQVW